MGKVNSEDIIQIMDITLKLVALGAAGYERITATKDRLRREADITPAELEALSMELHAPL